MTEISRFKEIVAKARELAAREGQSHQSSRVLSARLSRPAQALPAPPAGAARLVFVGKFEPSVMPLMEKIISAMGLERGRVDLADSTPGQSLLEAALSALAPALIVPLGNQAARLLLDPGTDVQQVHGKDFLWKGIPVIPSFGLAEMLYDEGLKKPAWADFQRVRDEFKSLS